MLLEAFLREVGPALSKVKDLVLYLKAESGSAVTASLLDESLALLVGACPMLSRLKSQGRLSQTFLRHVGEACPLLTELTILSESQDLPDLQKVLLLLPSLLPNVDTLWLPLHRLHRRQDVFPDMSSNTGLRNLYLHRCIFDSEKSWQCLPPKLLTLECFAIRQGPPATGPGGQLLHSLLGLSVACHVPMRLDSLAQLLRCAPNLKVITDNHGYGGLHTIDCTFNPPTAAADLSTLRGRMEIDAIKHAVYRFGYNEEYDVMLFPPLLAALPCMAGVERCEVQYCLSSDLGPLLAVFPDVRELSLLGMEEMGDVGMQALASCAKLTSLTLEGCSKATPIGLFALCTRLPGLCSVVHNTCTLLKAPALDSFKQLLQRDITLQEVVREDEDEDEDEDE